jgi:hypothetical protein
MNLERQHFFWYYRKNASPIHYRVPRSFSFSFETGIERETLRSEPKKNSSETGAPLNRAANFRFRLKRNNVRKTFRLEPIKIIKRNRRILVPYVIVAFSDIHTH